MRSQGVDPAILLAWLSARSIARGLPPPVADRGGFRVDTHMEAEVKRWVFPAMNPGLRALARTITEPRHPLKLCGTVDELRSALVDGWTLHAPAYFMRANGTHPGRPLADGYRLEIRRAGATVEARILSDTGLLAASGHAAETRDAFIYDRIATSPAHRRKGLGQCMMAALQSTKRHAANPELLVATEEGKALYTALGWQIISPYATASIMAC